MGVDEDCFQQPWTSTCMNRVQELANENWKKYIAQEASDMKGHLMPYPIKVNVDPVGKLELIPETKTFLDVGGRILGKNYAAVPDSLVA